MKKLLNTLYVTSPDSYLSVDGENVVILDKEVELGRVPLHNLEAIVCLARPLWAAVRCVIFLCVL